MAKSESERSHKQSVNTGLEMTNLKSLNRNEKGTVMLEFVISVSILLVIFLAAITLSCQFADYYGIQKVAREGAREASVTGDVDWGRAKALQSAWLWGLKSDKINVSFSQESTTVTCNVSYVSTPMYKKFLKMIDGKTLKDITLRSRARFVWSLADD